MSLKANLLTNGMGLPLIGPPSLDPRYHQAWMDHDMAFVEMALDGGHAVGLSCAFMHNDRIHQNAIRRASKGYDSEVAQAVLKGWVSSIRGYAEPKSSGTVH